MTYVTLKPTVETWEKNGTVEFLSSLDVDPLTLQNILN